MLIKNKLFAILNDRLIKSYTHGIFPTINYLKLIKLINLIKPYNLGYDLIRVGPSGDGGYLVPDVLKKIKTCFSPGVGNVHGFENDLLERGIKVFMADGTVEKPILLNKNYEFLKKNLGGHEDDKTTTLNSWMDSKETQDDLLLQMDIEGSEYEVVNSLDELNLKKFKYPTYHFGSGENYSLTKVINFINDNYKDKKIIAGKGYAPWSNDSIIRGPMISSQQINFYKPKTKLLEGIRKYIKFISENKNA